MDPHLKLTLLVTRNSTMENMAQKRKKNVKWKTTILVPFFKDIYLRKLIIRIHGELLNLTKV